MEKHNAAVYVRHANKSYGSKQILDKFSMTVPKGYIYGLLGASGCGKTTLLSCIVGRKQFESGEVWVLGGKPGSRGSGVPGPKVGYMPQDVALVAEFTIRDALYYFGKIFSMSDKAIEEKLQELTILLDLPPADRQVGKCSGGQQRRVSFAVALINNPELLILDEPTVGLDPILRDRIWNYLVELTEQKGTSIIITTHYIEETRQAHRIGLLRQGKLLAEESPATLLTTFGTETLEEVFLILSQKQSEGRLEEFSEMQRNMDERNSDAIIFNSEDSSVHHLGVGSTDLLTPIKKTKKPPVISSVINGHRLKALSDKNWKQFHRNIGNVSFMVIFPIIQMMAFLTAIGGDIHNINMAIVNEENNYKSCDGISKNGTAVYDPKLDSCDFNQLGCRFIDTINISMLSHVYYDNVDEAIQDVRRGKVTGVLHIHKNFSSSLEDKVQDAKNLPEDVLEQTQIDAHMDMSNRQIGTTIKFELIDKVIEMQKEVLADCGYLKKVGDVPLKYEGFIYGEKEESYIIFVIPGALITMIFFLGTTNTSTIIISDRLEGVWDRSIVAGVTSAEILIIHFLTQFLIIILQTIIILVITFAIFKYHYEGSMYLIVLIIILQGFAGIGFGFLISVVCSDHNTANIISTGSFYPMVLICGMVWPIESQPFILRLVSQCLPFTIPILSLRSVFKKGLDITHFDVLNGIGVEVFWLLFFTVISAYKLKKRR